MPDARDVTRPDEEGLHRGDTSTTTRRWLWWTWQLTALVLLLPLALGGLALTSEWAPWWGSRVPPPGDYGIGQVVVWLVLVLACAGLWLLAWLLGLTGRAHLVMLSVCVLITPVSMNLWAASQAWRYRPAALAAHRQEEYITQTRHAAFGVEHDRAVHDWLTGLAVTADRPRLRSTTTAAGTPHLIWNGVDHGSHAWFQQLPRWSPPTRFLQPALSKGVVLLRADLAIDPSGYDERTRVLSLVGPGGGERLVATGRIWSAALSPDGAWLAYDQQETGATSQQIVVVDTATWRVRQRYPLSENSQSQVIGWTTDALLVDDSGWGLPGATPAAHSGTPWRPYGQLLRYPTAALGVPQPTTTDRAPAGQRVGLGPGSFRQIGGNRMVSAPCGGQLAVPGSSWYRAATQIDGPSTWPTTLGDFSGGDTCLGGRGASVVDVKDEGATAVWRGDHPLTISPDGRYLVLADLSVVDLQSPTRLTSLSPTLTQLLSTKATFEGADFVEVGRPLLAGFWHDTRTVELTVWGTPAALCSVPLGPCRRFTGTILPAPQPLPTPLLPPAPSPAPWPTGSPSPYVPGS